jgi:hypothetical protein
MTSVSQEARIEIWQERGPRCLGIGRMEQLPGKVRPGIYFNEEFAQFDARQPLGDAVGEGLGTRWPGVRRLAKIV